MLAYRILFIGVLVLLACFMKPVAAQDIKASAVQQAAADQSLRDYNTAALEARQHRKRIVAKLKRLDGFKH